LSAQELFSYEVRFDRKLSPHVDVPLVAEVVARRQPRIAAWNDRLAFSGIVPLAATRIVCNSSSDELIKETICAIFGTVASQILSTESGADVLTTRQMILRACDRDFAGERIPTACFLDAKCRMLVEQAPVAGVDLAGKSQLQVRLMESPGTASLWTKLKSGLRLPAHRGTFGILRTIDAVIDECDFDREVRPMAHALLVASVLPTAELISALPTAESLPLLTAVVNEVMASEEPELEVEGVIEDCLSAASRSSRLKLRT
jgi:hypothetical protein